MVTKNSICTLMKTLKSPVASDDFKSKHNTEKTAFTRNRKLSFQDIIFFLLGMPRKSLPTELALYFGQKDTGISKQAFSKARYKIPEEAFHEIFQLTTDIHKFDSNPKTYDGYRVFAVDGSEIAVPHNHNTEKTFGLFKSMNTAYPMARLSVLYDVTNNLIADAQFTGITTGEREHAHKLLSSPMLTETENCKNLLLFDRGYPSRELIHGLEDRGFCYLIRCTHSFLGCVNECPDGDHTVTDDFKGRTVRLHVLKDTSGGENKIRRIKNPHAHGELFGEEAAGNLSGIICRIVPVKSFCIDKICSRVGNTGQAEYRKAYIPAQQKLYHRHCFPQYPKIGTAAKIQKRTRCTGMPGSENEIHHTGGQGFCQNIKPSQGNKRILYPA